MFPTTLFSQRTIAISVLTLLVKCKQSDAHLTLSLSETQVTRIQPMVDAPVQGIVAAAGAPIDPTGADAFLGLQNEGSVLTVSVGVGVGSGGGTYKLVVDSGSPNFWLASPSCQGCKINSAVQRYTPNTTQSYREAPYGRASLKYAIGDIAGSYGTDTFSLGDRQVSNVTLISVDEARTWLFDTKDQDVVGILPLGHGALMVQDQNGQTVEVPTPLQALFNNGSIDSPVCGVHVSSENPQLTIGGVDESLTWNEAGKAVLPSMTDEYHYQVPLQNALVRSNETVAFPNDTVIFDTAASHIFGPWDAVATIYEKIGGIRFLLESTPERNLTLPALPCQGPENFSFSFGFGGKQFPVAYEALVNTKSPLRIYKDGQLDMTQNANDVWCNGNLQNTSMFGWTSQYDNKDRRWLMGLPFLRSVYSSWNFDNGEVTLWPLDQSVSTGGKSTESNTTSVQDPPAPASTNETLALPQNQTALPVSDTTTSAQAAIATSNATAERSSQTIPRANISATEVVASQTLTITETLATVATATVTENVASDPAPTSLTRDIANTSSSTLSVSHNTGVIEGSTATAATTYAVPTALATNRKRWGRS